MRRGAARSALRWAPLGLALAWSAVVLATGVGTEAWQPGYDLAVYRDGAADLLAGRDPYARTTGRGHFFVYPPVAAVLFLPLLLVPPGAGLLLWDALLVLALVAGGRRLLRAAGAPAALVPAALALVVVSDPFREALVLGQVSPLVVLALVGGTALARRSPGVGGALTGAAAAVKVTPALVLLLAAARPWRSFALRVALAGAALTAVGALAAPASWRSYFLDLLWRSGRVAPAGTTSNNSLAGALAHAGVPAGAAAPAGTAAGLVLVAAVLVVLLRRARADELADGPAGARAPGAGEALRWGLVVSLLSCLVSPVTWSHHALAAPLAAVALAAASSSGAVRAVALAALVPWLLPVLQWAAAAGGAGTAAGVLTALTRPLSALVLVGLLLPRGRGGPGGAAVTGGSRVAGSA
ncbi:glycosyltransferase 87 family protein [Kineococcus sp. SYSU DK005]|uniref:glycosyltransferase 87 family protein n=1 Tax=Kineococcus sp. SYSU DK005 TaxID=3383126 RepID=UPI003D7D1D6F